MVDVPKVLSLGSSFSKSKRDHSSRVMKFHLFHQSGGTVQSSTEQDEHLSLSNKEDDTLDWSSHSSAVLTVSVKPANSDAIIDKVDGIYKEFSVFQTNLKKLLSLYKEKHLAMKTLNEKRFDTAKTLDVMFGNSPLSSAVAQGCQIAPVPHPICTNSCLSALGKDEYSENSTVGEGSGVENPFKKAVQAEFAKFFHDNEEEARRQRTSDATALGVEEPSISLHVVDERAEPHTDLPEDVSIPNNQVCKVTSTCLAERLESGCGVKVIVNGEADKHDGTVLPSTKLKHSLEHFNPEVVNPSVGATKVTNTKISHDVTWNRESDCKDLREGIKKVTSPEIDYKQDDPYSKVNAMITWQKMTDGRKSMVYYESRGPMLICLYSYSLFYKDNDSEELHQAYWANESIEEKKEQEDNTNQSFIPSEDITEGVEEEKPRVEKETCLSNDCDNKTKENDGKTKSPIQSSPEKACFNSFAPFSEEVKQSYYDVHKANYMESMKYLEQHNNLVKYIEDWEHVLFQRTHVLYTEYMKHRKNLYHYNKKVETLKKEMSKLQKVSEEKDKPVPPKKMEKLERNVLKLTGARDTHDNSGESLFLFLDEVVNRSWRDIFPLLQRAVKFDQDYTTMEAKMIRRLRGTTELLDLIGKQKSISMTSRLKSLETLNPEVIYSGGQALGVEPSSCMNYLDKSVS